MAFKLEWYDGNKRIIIGEISGELSVTEIENLSAGMNEYLAAGNAPVHFILNSEHLDKFPTSITVLKNAVTFLGKPRLGWIIIYGGSRMMLTFARVLMQITPTRYRSVGSLQEALTFLAGVDVSLGERQV